MNVSGHRKLVRELVLVIPPAMCFPRAHGHAQLATCLLRLAAPCILFLLACPCLRLIMRASRTAFATGWTYATWWSGCTSTALQTFAYTPLNLTGRCQARGREPQQRAAAAGAGGSSGGRHDRVGLPAALCLPALAIRGGVTGLSCCTQVAVESRTGCFGNCVLSWA